MNLVGNSNEEKIWNYLKSKNFNDYACAGIMGNLYAESGLNPHNLQNTGNKKLGMTDDEYVVAIDNGTYTKDQFVNDGQGAFLAQWTFHSRKKALYEYAKSQNKSIGDLSMQLNFLYKELSENYKTLLSTLKTATSVLEASNAVLFQYEKPADQSESVQEKRASYSQKYYDKYATVSSANTGNIGTIGGNKKMKYNENNKPLVCMQTTSRCYKGTRTMDVKGVLWHSTGANNPNLKRYVQPSDNAPDKEYWLNLLGKNKYNNDWNHSDRQAGMNCWIGKLADGTVTTVQTMPWNYRPWGCGSGKKGSCNNTHIQFEICEDSMYDEKYFEAAYKEACEITAYLCKMYNLDPHGTTITNGVKVPVILCHYDSYHLGLGNNHGDIYTWFKKHGKDMDDVRNDVAVLMKSDNSIITAPSSPVVPTTPTTPSVPAFESYKVKITANVLNVRAGASTRYNIVGKLNKGDIVTVIGKDGDWEKISDGYIYSDCTEKVVETIAPETTTSSDVKKDVIVKIASDATYYSGKDMPTWVKNKNWIVKSVNGDRVVIDKSEDGKHTINSPVNAKYLTVVTSGYADNSASASAFESYKVRVTVDALNIRKGAGTNYDIVGVIKDRGIYTIIDESNGKGATKWLFLKSGAGWIASDHAKKV